MASSILTEKGDANGVRSLTQEVEHIKQLVARAQAAPPSAAGGITGSITAQVFRRQSPVQQQNVTQTQLFRERPMINTHTLYSFLQLYHFAIAIAIITNRVHFSALTANEGRTTSGKPLGVALIP